jgi:hypothetical protein
MIIMTIIINFMLLSILLASANSSLLIAIILRKMVALPDNHTKITALTGLHNDNYEAVILSYQRIWKRNLQ